MGFICPNFPTLFSHLLLMTQGTIKSHQIWESEERALQQGQEPVYSTLLGLDFNLVYIEQSSKLRSKCSHPTYSRLSLQAFQPVYKLPSFCLFFTGWKSIRNEWRKWSNHGYTERNIWKKTTTAYTHWSGNTQSSLFITFFNS